MRLDNYTVPDTELKVKANLRIETKSLGGTTSASDRTNNGIKPKTFTVSLLIPKKKAEDLTALITTAETIDDKGRLKVYAINDETANAMKVRQVQFTDNINVREEEGREAWQVSFMLVEYFSVSEKVEQRQVLAKAKEQILDGVGVTAVVDDITEQAQELTGFESLLQTFDNALA